MHFAVFTTQEEKEGFSLKKSKSRKIGDKIQRAVIIVSILTSIIIGSVGIICINIINSTTQLEYNQNLVPLSHLYKVETDLLSMRVLLRNMALAKDSNVSIFTNYVNSLYTYINDINVNEQIYGKSITNENQLKNYKNMQDEINKYNSTVNNIQSKIISGNLPEAMEIMNSTEQEISTSLDQYVDIAFKINSDQAKQHNEKGIVIFFVAMGSVLILIVVSILIARKTSRKIADRISSPINDMVEAANSIANGNLDINIDIKSEDETGILADSFKKIITSLQLLKNDVEMLIENALVGNLEIRADLDKHNGDYRLIIQGVNEMLDAVKAPLDLAYNFIGKLAKGDHQVEIENTYEGYYGKLIDNLNDVRASIVILEGETKKLAAAGESGDLEVRGDETKLSGVYAEIIRGINKTFDSIKEPLDVSSIFIDKLANGKKTAAIENAYNGYYAKLIDNLNDVNKSIYALLAESEKMNVACENGNLSVRGDTGNLKGNYAEIINGFNRTLDSVVAPITESEKVLAKMALNDYTIQMSDNYKGILNEFAMSINSVRNRLVSIEKIVSQVGIGQIDALDSLVKIGKRSENDKMMPSLILMMTAIKDLIEVANNQASAAIEGNLEFRGDEENFNGCYRKVIEGMNRTIESIAAPIDESSSVLKELAQGNLDVKMTGIYKGEYNSIKTYLNSAIDSFNELISEISISASQVATGSKQISDASQSLSQGTTEQASSIEELTSSIIEVADKAKENYKNITDSSKITSEAQEEAKLGNKKMEDMLESMKAINESSTSISKIIKVIDDIAFQTNILALNAAVEAARAGQYGKGFAVVAEEVRNLASKSAQAANETASLIEGSISKVKAGAKIANETADILLRINNSIKKASEYADNVVSSSNEQANAITQINNGISQVSAVVQTSSATAQESAASSEELSGQAEVLKEMVGRFKLRSSSGNGDIISQSSESEETILNNDELGKY